MVGFLMDFYVTIFLVLKSIRNSYWVNYDKECMRFIYVYNRLVIILHFYRFFMLPSCKIVLRHLKPKW